MSADLSQAGLLKSDPQLASVHAAHWNHLANEETLAATKTGLEAHGHKVSIVNDKKEALELVIKSIPSGASIMNAGSRTLEEIGYTEHAKAHSAEHGWKNLHAEILAEQDQAKAAQLRRLSIGADYFLSSVCAVAQTGEIVVGDLTGSRTGAFPSAAGNLILVVGSNKIVKDEHHALKRAQEFCLPVESARVRIVYKVPASALNNIVTVRGSNPWGKPGRIHVIIVKELLGF